MTNRYDDIIDLPHHTSERHPRMPAMDRAAQFSPFAALTGYEGVIRETARRTEQRAELEEDAAEVLDQVLRRVAQRLPERPEVRVTYFRPDEKKRGGAYVTAVGAVKRIDLVERTLVMEDGREIPVGEMVELEELEIRN